MDNEHSKRSLLKTITWRITASLDTFIIAWVITGDWKIGGSIVGIEVITKMFFIIFMKEYGIKLNGVKKRSGGGYLNLSAISSAKYVTIALAPALLKEIKLSYIASSFKILFFIPFLIKLYSPDTW